MPCCKPVRLRDPPVQIDGTLPLTSREPEMDLNYLYHRHGTSLMLAEQASCAQSRSSHRQLAAGYAARIGALLRANTEAAL